MPHSFAVLLQLPPTQLGEVLLDCQELQTKLLDHISKLTDSQRAHIPASLMDVIRDPSISQIKVEIKQEMVEDWDFLLNLFI